MLSFVEKRLIEAAADDPEVRAQLKQEPARVVSRILDRPMPADIEVRVHEEGDGEVIFALPPLGVAQEVPEPSTRRHVFENVLIERHNQDADGSIRKAALAQPLKVFEELTGNGIGDILAPDQKPRLLEDSATCCHLVLPQETERFGDELPDDLLDYVSGGGPSPCNSSVGGDRYDQEA